MWPGGHSVPGDTGCTGVHGVTGDTGCRLECIGSNGTLIADWSARGHTGAELQETLWIIGGFKGAEVQKTLGITVEC